MAEILWADYSWARPDVDRYEGVMRYLDADRGTRPDLTKDEVADLHAQGKKVGLIWQADKGGAKEGEKRGAADARRANRQADLLGAPDTAAIFYTVDADFTPKQVAGYFDGVRSVPGRPVGIYGSARIVEWAHSVGIDWRWQTLAWSAGVISEHAHLYQRDHNVDEGTGLLDRNVVYAPFPSWEPKAAKPKPKPKPKPEPEPENEGRPVNIITRKQWGAKPWTSQPYTATMRERTHFLVHYHGGPPPNATGKWVPKNVEAIHLGNGWSGVGYNFLVDQDGVIYEGRGWGLVGAHCPGKNRTGIGVYVAVGGNQAPTDAAKAAVVWLYREASRRAGRTLTTGVHGDWYSTQCAGPKLTPWVHAGMHVNGGAPIDRTITVRELQELLGVTADGIVGPVTEAAVRDLQQALGVTVDGDPGPNTMEALMTLLDQMKALEAKIDRIPNRVWGHELDMPGVAKRLFPQIHDSYTAGRLQSYGIYDAGTKGLRPRILAAVESHGDVDKAALAKVIADSIRDDVVAAVASAGSGATAEQIADELGARLAQEQAVE